MTQNTSGNTQNIVYNNPGFIDSITYASNGITYPKASTFTLSQSDCSLFLAYKLQFYNALLQNFKTVTSYFNIELPVCLMEIQSLSSPNTIRYHQTSTSTPTTHVYNITFDRDALTTTFAARPSAITITLQEYLNAFQLIQIFFNQIALA